MAKPANTENVARADNPPDYAGANNLIQEILAEQQNSSKISGKISAIYKRIGEKRVDAAAARIVTTLYKMQPENRIVTLRSLFGMLEADPEAFQVPMDMVDMMQADDKRRVQTFSPGTVVPLNRGGRKKKEEAPKEDEQSATGAEEEVGTTPADNADSESDAVAPLGNLSAPMEDPEDEVQAAGEEANPGFTAPDALDGDDAG